MENSLNILIDAYIHLQTFHKENTRSNAFNINVCCINDGCISYILLWVFFKKYVIQMSTEILI